MKSRKERWLKKRKVRLWYEYLARSSEATADAYLYSLSRFCEDVGIEPEEVTEDEVVEYATKLTNSQARLFVNAVKSWARFTGKSLNLSFKVKVKSRIAEVERVPSREELRRVLDVADLRTKVMISLMAFSGLRPEVIGNYRGTDGLKVMDVESAEPGKPVKVTVRSELSKAGHQYFTFLSVEGREYLELYLRTRGELKPEDPVIAGRGGKHLTTHSVSSAIRKAIRLAGFDWRPYVLRHYFDTYMLLAEASGLVVEDYRTFWMGHKGNVEHQYTTNKNRLPRQLVEDMREKYERASAFLETRVKVREDRTKRQKVVKAEELDEYLEKGWEFLAALPDGRIVIRR